LQPGRQDAAGYGRQDARRYRSVAVTGCKLSQNASADRGIGRNENGPDMPAEISF
jgi:hypothetical protein